MSHDVQTIVIGAGVVGLAIARKFARLGHEVLILEAEESGQHHTSARNSQVIHAGMYYPVGSLKARLCVEGLRRLYDFCQTRHVPHKRIEKLICATDPSQSKALKILCDQGIANGVSGLQLLDRDAAIQLEPNLDCVGALYSPSTGILDVPTFMTLLLSEAQSEGAVLAIHAPVQGIRSVAKGFELSIDDTDRTTLICKNVINAAGLGAWDVARNTSGFSSDLVPFQSYMKGCYFSLATNSKPFDRLIYPVADRHSLGVHYVLDLAGRVTLGPNLVPLVPPRVDYSNNMEMAPALESSIRRFWPDMPHGALQMDTCGIRPRISQSNEPLADFRILGPNDHGMAGSVHLLGIESPGLTSSMAIAAYVADLI